MNEITIVLQNIKKYFASTTVPFFKPGGQRALALYSKLVP
jgi:hypothetical protein